MSAGPAFQAARAITALISARAGASTCLCRRTGRLEEIDPGPAEELGRALERVEQSLRERGYAELGRVVDFFGDPPGIARGSGQSPASIAREGAGGWRPRPWDPPCPWRPASRDP